MYVSQPFGGTYHLRLQGRKSAKQKNQREQVPPKRRLIYILHGAISQKMGNFCAAILARRFVEVSMRLLSRCYKGDYRRGFGLDDWIY
jgi:hypothetical protein